MAPFPRISSQNYCSKRFGHLTSLGRSRKLDDGRPFELVRCDCGTEKLVLLYDLVAGHQKSCGCMRPHLVAAAKQSHGYCGTPTYSSWTSAKARCFNPHDKRWLRYGGRGITMCERWESSFPAFLADMGEKPSRHHELDRRNNDGNYEPENCRWVLRRENLNNTSQCRMLTAFGHSMTLAQWARHTGIEAETIRGRLKRGWTLERAFSEGATSRSDLAAIQKIIAETDRSNADAMDRALHLIGEIIKARLARGTERF